MTKTIKRSRLSNIAMVAGGEEKISAVLDGDRVKEWVGIGWIDVTDHYTPAEIAKLPVVID